jgi:hypothetical protein
MRDFLLPQAVHRCISYANHNPLAALLRWRDNTCRMLGRGLIRVKNIVSTAIRIATAMIHARIRGRSRSLRHHRSETTHSALDRSICLERVRSRVAHSVGRCCRVLLEKSVQSAVLSCILVSNACTSTPAADLSVCNQSQREFPRKMRATIVRFMRFV